MNEIQGWKTTQDLQWMEQTASQMNSVAEIGCWRGRGTQALLSGCNGKVTAIDIWKFQENTPEAKLAQEHDIFLEFYQNLKDFKNLVIWQMTAQQALELAERENRKFDMVFIDYRPTVEELKRWEKRAKKMIAGYDYQNFKNLIQEAFGEVEVKDLIWYKNL